MVKCVGLGLPFLASDTPEHRRAIELLGLDADFLVGPCDTWASRIDAIAADYANVKTRIAAARDRAFAAYGVARITADWLAFARQVAGR